MTLNRKTLTVIVIIIVVVAAVYLAAEWQKNRKTKELLVDLSSMDLDKANDAMVDLRSRGSSITLRLAEILERNAPTEQLAHARVAMVLNGLSSSRAVPALQQALKAKDDPGLRWAACAALASIGAGEAVPDILALAADGSEDINVRIVATRALGVLEAGEAVDPLITILEDRPAIEPAEEESVEEEAPEETPAGTKLGPEGAAKKMKAELDKELPAPAPLPQPKSAAPPEKAPEEPAKPPPPPDTTADLRPWAARALAAIHCSSKGAELTGADKLVPVLTASVDEEQEPVVNVRLAATQALVYYHTPDAVKALETAMDDPDPSVRCAAAWALGAQKDNHDEAVRVLRAHEEDDSWNTRQAVADSLERLGEKSNRHFKTNKI